MGTCIYLQQENNTEQLRRSKGHNPLKKSQKIKRQIDQQEEEENIQEDNEEYIKKNLNNFLKTQPAKALSIFKIQKRFSKPSEMKKSLKSILLKQSKIETKKVIKFHQNQQEKLQRNLSGSSKPINFDCLFKARRQPITEVYQLLQKIHTSPHSSIYKASHLKTKQIRAIKEIRFHKNTPHEEYYLKIQHQINIYKQMDHVNVAKLFDVFLYKSTYYLVMQFCFGGTLEDCIEFFVKADTCQPIANLMKELLSFICYIHDKNIIYRSIKPKNILFLHPLQKNAKPKIKMIDFKNAQQQKKGQNFLKDSGFGCDISKCGIIMYMIFRMKYEKCTFKQLKTLKIYNIKGPYWDLVDPSAKSLIKILIPNRKKPTITVKEVLNHPFIIDNASLQPLMKSQELQALEKMKTNFHTNKFITIIVSLVNSRKAQMQSYERLSDLFSRIDKNNNGTIDKEELAQLYRAVISDKDSPINEEEVEKILQNVDLNGSGKIDFSQFIIAMQGMTNLNNEKALEEAFDYLDRDRSGYLDKNQLIELFREENLLQILKLMKELDKNGDYRISRKQFFDYLLNITL